MNKKIIKDNSYIKLLDSIKARIQKAQIRVALAASHEMIAHYWDIGKKIKLEQDKFGWGKSIVERLAKDLKKEYPQNKGYSSRNLWDMRRLFIEYESAPKMRQLVAEIPWGQNILIMTRIKDMKERKYYLKSTKEMGWTRNVLLNQIKVDSYSRHISENKQHNFQKALPSHLSEQAEKSMKDSYMLDFLGIDKPVHERVLEKRMIECIKDVLLEFGQGFAFIGNQYKVSTKNKDYYIDLLFYQRKLNCLVAVELKVGAFEPEFAGKMNFYLNLLDDNERQKHENPSIGIILCAEKDRFDVEYALRGIQKPVGVAEFTLTRKIPAKLKKTLPEPAIIASKLEEELKRNTKK